MSYFININSSAVVVFTNKLEKIRKSALPNAVRGTLNSAAFDVKQKTMPLSADKHFEKRSPNFFKANSKVQMATGYDVKTMKSTVGFVSHNLQYNNEAVRDLQQQEHGGEIDKRSFIPMDDARRGGNATPVRPTLRLKVIGGKSKSGGLWGIPDVNKAAGKSRAEQYIKTAMYAGVGGFIIAGRSNIRSLYKVNSIKRIGGKTVVKSTPFYSFKSGRSVRIRKDTHFMREASLRSANKMEDMFVKEAKFQLAKIK